MPVDDIPGGTRRGWVAVVAVAVVAQAVLYAVILKYPEFTMQRRLGLYHSRWHALTLLCTAGPLWLVALWALHRSRARGRLAAVLLLGAGALLSVAAMLHNPSTSDDDYRYMWDGKVQLSGTDPYRYAPDAPQLKHLRDASLFGAPDHCTRPVHGGGCTSINRPAVHTVYPPVAEAAFTGMRLASFGGHGNHVPLQIFGALGALATGWLILRRDRAQPWLAALWTWCPVTIVEYANNAHIDWLGVLLVVVALGTVRGRVVTGVLVGAAVAVKLYPALVLPSLVRRSWWIAVTAIVFVALTYVPHVIAVGTDVIGYLPGYLKEEGYSSGQRFALLSAVMPDSWTTAVGVAIVAAVAVWAWRRGSVTDPALSAVTVAGVVLLVTTPAFGWYAGLLLALVAMTGLVEWLPIVFAASVSYIVFPEQPKLIYGAALALWLVMRSMRLTRERREAATVSPAAGAAATASAS